MLIFDTIWQGLSKEDKEKFNASLLKHQTTQSPFYDVVVYNKSINFKFHYTPKRRLALFILKIANKLARKIDNSGYYSLD